MVGAEPASCAAAGWRIRTAAARAKSPAFFTPRRLSPAPTGCASRGSASSGTASTNTSSSAAWRRPASPTARCSSRPRRSSSRCSQRDGARSASARCTGPARCSRCSASTSSSGRGAHVSGASLSGDAKLLGAVVCWALYTIGARPLMARHSPVGITALSMLLGTLLYVPLAAPAHWRACRGQSVSAITWIKLVYSSLFAHLRRLHDLVLRPSARSAAPGRRSTRTCCRSWRW